MEFSRSASPLMEGLLIFITIFIRINNDFGVVTLYYLVLLKILLYLDKPTKSYIKDKNNIFIF